MTTETAKQPTVAVKPGKRSIIGEDGLVRRYLTEDEWKQAAKIEVSERIYKRKAGKAERHRIINIFPQFTDSSGTDLRTIPLDDGSEVTGVYCVPRVMVEKFRIDEKSMGNKLEPMKVSLSSFCMDALDFVEDFERFPD